jgi:hypothetical protein
VEHWLAGLELSGGSKNHILNTFRIVLREAKFEEVKGTLKKAAELERIPYQAERERFIARASRTGSERTWKLYASALDRLEG